MISRILATTALAVIVILLAWYLAHTEQPGPEPLITTLAGFAPESIRQILISRAGMDEIVLAKPAMDWHMNSPVQVRANPFRINSILALAEAPALALSGPESVDLHQLGLAAAAVTLVLDGHVFAFGHTDPIGGGRYVMYNETVYIIEDNLYQQLLQDPGFFISTRLLDTDSRLVRINYPGFELHNRDNVWVPVGDNIKQSADELKQLVSNWTDLEASRVTTSRNENYPVDIVLVTEADGQIELSVAATPSGLILTRKDRGLDYWFSPDTAAQLLIAQIQGP